MPEPLFIISVLVPVAAGIAALLGWKGIIPSAQDLWRRITKKPAQYQYCTITYYKEHASTTGNLTAITDNQERLYHQVPYSVFGIFRLGVEPDSRVKQNMEALMRLVDRLKADGWVFIGLRDVNVWYSYRFRRPVR